ncbi:MAG: hypothetical protein ACXWNJ_13665 [Vulcanimicrobiaceae bacterium]
MRRHDFLASAIALAALQTFPGRASAEAIAQPELVAGLPLARPGQWVRYIMGFGQPYLKQIGFGIERTPRESRYYVETETGIPGGACNPNTIKKAYLRANHFGPLLSPYAIEAYVAKAGDMVMLYQGPDAPSSLLLLDDKHLYTSAPCTVRSRGSANVRAAGKTIACTHVALDVPARRESQSQTAGALQSFAVWTSPHVTLGLVMMHARVVGLEPFELTLDSHGPHFTSGIPESLDAVRATGGSG